MENFADRLIAAIEKKGTPACVGIDPQFDSLPTEIRECAVEKNAAGAQAACIIAFQQEVLDIVAPYVATVKLQSAFYEMLGTAGVQAYADAVNRATLKGLIVIGDVKRNDIGSTAEAYAAAHLRVFPQDANYLSLGVDAVTVNPYLGSDGVEPFIKAAKETGRGVFILVKTSNKSSGDFQDLKVEGNGRTETSVELFVKVAEKVNEWGSSPGLVGKRGYSCVGAVVGATYPEQAARLRKLMPKAYFLVPGYGAQGGSGKDVVPCFNSDGRGAIVNSSRGIIYAWTRSPYKEQFGEARWRDAIDAATKAMIADIHAALPQSGTPAGPGRQTGSPRRK